MSMMKGEHTNIVSFIVFLFICLTRLIGEVIGYNVLFNGLPFLWISLSLGFLLTWQGVFKELEVYSVIFTWMRESFNRLMLNFTSGKWRASVNWSGLIALLALMWPAWDLVSRWNIVRHRWAVGFPHYAQMFLHIAVLLYILFIFIQGLYLVSVMTSTKVVYKYNKEKVQKSIQNLIIVNLCLLMYDGIWIMTTFAIEGGEHYLLKLLNLGYVGLIAYDICAIVALANLQRAISNEPDSSTGTDDPTQSLSWLQWLIPVFLILSVAREFHSLILPSSIAVLLPVSFLVVGSLVIVLKMYLLHSYLAVPNFISLLLDMQKGPVYKKITAGSAYIGALIVISWVVNLSQGYDSYRRWLSHENPAFVTFLAFYGFSYNILIPFEGLLAIWQLSYQGHTQYKREESTKRSLVIAVLSACQETSFVFALYHTIFVVYLPDAGLNYTTLARISGPVLFHLSMGIVYLHLKDKCYMSPVQVRNCKGNADSTKHKIVSQHQSQNFPKAPKFKRPFSTATSGNAGAAMCQSFLRLGHRASSTIPNYASSLHSLLVPLAALRCLMLGDILVPLLPSWFIIRCYWCAYILVCAHWVMVMHRELHGITVVKKCYSSICRIVKRGHVCKYPMNMCWGIVFLLAVVLTMLNIYFRASHSAHEWAGPKTLALQIMVPPLLGVHVYAILLQALLLYGAITAIDTLTEATENCEIPIFTENLPKLMHINVVLFIDHLIFAVLRGDGVIYKWPLLIFHSGSIFVINVLQQRGKELDKPRDAPDEPERAVADPTQRCPLAKWVPLENTDILMKLTAVVGIGRLAVMVNSFQGDWIIVVLFRFLVSLTLAVVNYYIYRTLTKQLVRYSQKHNFSLPKRKLPLFLYFTVGLIGITEVVYTFYYQWTAEGAGLLLLNVSLAIVLLMNAALIIHEDALVILLVSLDSQVEEKYSNLKQALQLVLYLNMFFAGFGAFSSFLAWLVSDGGSLIHLLGHLTCAILLPTMASPVLEKMYNDINKDLQCDEIGTNEEGKGFNERVHGSLPTIPEAIRQSRLRGAACKE